MSSPRETRSSANVRTIISAWSMWIPWKAFGRNCLQVSLGQNEGVQTKSRVVTWKVPKLAQSSNKQPAQQVCVFLFWSLYKRINSMLSWVCSVIDHRWRQNVGKTSVTHSPVARLCFYNILTSSSAIYRRTAIELLLSLYWAPLILCVQFFPSDPTCLLALCAIKWFIHIQWKTCKLMASQTMTLSPFWPLFTYSTSSNEKEVSTRVSAVAWNVRLYWGARKIKINK